MGSTVASIIARIRDTLAEETAKQFADDELALSIDEAHKIIASKTPMIEADKSFALVANQYKYSTFSDFIASERVLYRDKDVVEPINIKDLVDWGNARRSADQPAKYSIFNNCFILDPIPSADSETTTLNGTCASGATTITVVSTTDFEERGRLLIEAEEIEYYDKSTTQLLQCVRGRGGTTQAEHASGTTITQADIQVFYFRQPTTLSSSSITEIPIRYDNLLVTYGLAWAYFKRNELEQSDFLFRLFFNTLKQSVGEVRDKKKDTIHTLKPNITAKKRALWT